MARPKKYSNNNIRLTKSWVYINLQEQVAETRQWKCKRFRIPVNQMSMIFDKMMNLPAKK